MSEETLKRLPRTSVVTSEFDCYRRDSNKFAARLHKQNKLAEFYVLPGLNHGSPLLLPA